MLPPHDEGPTLYVDRLDNYPTAGCYIALCSGKTQNFGSIKAGRYFVSPTALYWSRTCGTRY